MNRIKRYFPLGLILGIAVVLLIIGSFYDMRINKELFAGSSNIMTILGGIAGKLPAFIMLGVCFTILLAYVKVNPSLYNRTWRIILMCLYAVAILLSAVLAVYSAFEEITGKAKYLALIGGVIIAMLAVWFVWKIKWAYLDELKKWAILTVIAIAVIIILVTVIKTFWGRERYISVITSDAKYTEWYIPRGMTGGDSFPSGHTALWGALYMIIPLFGIFGYKGENFTAALIFLLQLLIGVFRIAGGYHFISDVSISIIISSLTCFVVMFIGYNKDYSDRTLSKKSIFRFI